jgi:hypothetical protein
MLSRLMLVDAIRGDKFKRTETTGISVMAGGFFAAGLAIALSRGRCDEDRLQTAYRLRALAALRP